MASSSSSPPLVTAVSSPGEGLVAVAHPQQDVPGRPSSAASSSSSSTTWRVGLYNFAKGGYLQTTLTASSGGNEKNRAVSGRIQKLLFLGGDGSSSSSSSHFLAAVSSRGVAVWDLRRGVVSHTILPSSKKSNAASASHYTILDAQVATDQGSPDADANARSLYLLVQHGDAARGGGSDHDDNDHDNDGGDGGTKSVIWQYDGPRLVRKIKTKAGAANSRLLVTDGAHLLYVSCRRKLRVHSGETGKVVKKLSFPSPIIAVAAASAAAFAASGSRGAYVLLESGQIHRAHPNDDSSNTTPVAATAASLTLETCPASTGSTGDDIIVDGKSLINLSGEGEARKSSPNPLLDLTTADSGVVRCATGGGGALTSKGRGATVLVAVLYKGGTVQIQSRALRGADGAVLDEVFSWRDDEAGPSASADRSGKRSKAHGEKGDTPAILGPAQAGGTARHVHEPGMAAPESNDGAAASDKNEGGDDDGVSPPRKRSRSVEEQNDETIASRLAQLRAQLIADEEEEARLDAAALSEGAMTVTAAGGEIVTFQPKKATTESLSQLLKQALQDDALLELCLAVSNLAIIRESVSHLPSSDVSALVAAITSRVAFRPARAEVLCLWLTVLLQTRKASLDVLQPLQNLINDRVELLPALLKLEGRLSLLNP